MEMFLKETSFHGVMLDSFFIANNEFKTMFGKMFKEHLKTGSIRPLTRTVFADDQVEQAFRLL